MLQIEISVGELLDKLSILTIKKEKIVETEKLEYISKEFDLLNKKSQQFLESKAVRVLYDNLKSINIKLWMIEDDIRVLEKHGDFGAEFINLARKVYKTNDKRFLLKQEINNICGSAIREQKGYK